MRWEDVKDFDGPLPTIALKQQKTGNALVIPIAEPLRRALRAIPKAERIGCITGKKIGEAYTHGRRRNFNRGWRDLLNTVKLADMVDVPTLAKIDGSGSHGGHRPRHSAFV